MDRCARQKNPPVRAPSQMVHLPSSPVGEGAGEQQHGHLSMSRHAHGRALVPGRHDQKKHLWVWVEWVRVRLVPSNRFVNEQQTVISVECRRTDLLGLPRWFVVSKTLTTNSFGTYVLLLPSNWKSRDKLHFLGTCSGRICRHFCKACYGLSRIRRSRSSRHCASPA